MSSRDAFDPLLHAGAPAFVFAPATQPSARAAPDPHASDDDVLSHFMSLTATDDAVSGE